MEQMVNKEQLADDFGNQFIGQSNAWAAAEQGYLAGWDACQQNLQQTACYTPLPLSELGDFVDWIRDNDWKMYAEGWCELGGSNGWHCTTDELLQMFRDRGNGV